MQSESEALLKEALQSLEACVSMLAQADCSTGYCCCGSPVDRHGFGDGHSPVDEGDYYQQLVIERARGTICKIQSYR